MARSSVQIYLRDIGEIPLLTREDEADLAKKAREGDVESHRKLVRSNLRLVVNIAKKYANLGLPFLDLVEEGNIGLMKAVDKYDLSRGCRLSTYASWWIRQAIMRALANNGKIVRIPVYMIEKMAHVQRAIDKLHHDNNRIPTNTEIAEEVGESVKTIIEIRDLLQKPSYLFSSLKEDDMCSLIDMIEDTDALSPLQTLCANMLQDDMLDLLNLLSDREKKILVYRFGLNEEKPRTLEEIGALFNITRERVRQIEVKAVKKLRKILQEHKMEYKDYSM
ncbi:MAG: RNA polymerase sigma factor RpoD/SigA [Candidatus Auribacterota bacterium]|jgi:RNA polymerase primary sigma factor|uniref:RNA polymerase sigma factor n=1 Tax=Candidatus Auribacter fodinae TaxID=2093366 RepID=A0A3A4RAR3_9BACT|nr:MAG: RNA polymerase sigma factor RpoD/SigA [Candidatus Auribacter fodinae]